MRLSAGAAILRAGQHRFKVSDGSSDVVGSENPGWNKGFAVTARRLRRFVAGAACVALLAGCAATTQKPGPGGHPLDRASIGVRPVPTEQDLPLHVLDGQFKLQAGEVRDGARAYVRAALLSDDLKLVEQATQLALLAGEWDAARQAALRWSSLSPGNPGVLQADAWIALGQRRDDEAFAAFGRLLDTVGDQGWRLTGQALMAAPDKSQAAALLARLATPQRLAANELDWVAMSQLAFRLGDKRMAQALSDDSVQRFHGVESYAWNAHLAIDVGEHAMARDIYAEGLRRHPHDSRLRTSHAALLAEMGDAGGAARSLAGGQQDDATYAARMTYAALADDKSVLQSLYREVRAAGAPTTAARRYLLGQLAELTGDHVAALAWYRQVSDDDERWFDAQLRQAVVLDASGRLDEALDFARRLQAETGIDNDSVAKAFLLEGDLFKRHRRETEARATYDRALGFMPDHDGLLYSRALLAAAAGDVTTAETDLRKLIAKKPDDAAALNALGYTLADKTDRLDEALTLIEAAFRLEPDEPSIIDSLGWVQFRSGHHMEAVATLRRAYEKFPDPEVASHYADALWAIGEREQARSVLAEALRRDPDSTIVAETMRRLKP